jgi:DNA-binding PadR family transcriptional regulator
MNHILTSALVGLASRLGKFERTLLIEIDRAGNDAYCAELSRRLSSELSREVTMGQVSRTLGALKRIGMLESEQRWPETPQKHMRHRLVFKLTDAGRVALDALKDNQIRSGFGDLQPALSMIRSM